MNQKKKGIAFFSTPQPTETFQPVIPECTFQTSVAAEASLYYGQNVVDTAESTDDDTFYDSHSTQNDVEETYVENGTPEPDSSSVVNNTTEPPETENGYRSENASITDEINELSRLTSDLLNAPPQSAIDEDNSTPKKMQASWLEYENNDDDEANRLLKSIHYIQVWLLMNHFVTMDMEKEVTHIYHENIKVAKKFLNKLFADPETKKFQLMIKVMYEGYTRAAPPTLATSFAVVIMWALGFPETIENHSYSQFRNMESLIADALCGSRDLFFLSFVKCVIGGYNSLNVALLMVLHKENEEMDEDNRIVFSDEISGFIDSQFMARIIPTSLPRKIFRNIKHISSAILYSEEERQLQAKFIEYTNTLMTDLNYFHMRLKTVDSDAAFNNNNQIMESWPGLGLTRTLCMPPKVDEEALRYSEFIGPFSKLELDGNLFYGHDTSLKNDVLPRRKILASVARDVTQMVSQEKMGLLNFMCKRPKACSRLTRIQKSYLKLIRNLNRYEKFVQNYEKGYVLGQIFKFCNLYKNEVRMLEEVWKEDINEDEQKKKIYKIMSKRSVASIMCLEFVLSKFLKFDKTYDKFEYKMRIHTLLDYSMERFEALFPNVDLHQMVV
ncbi:hypothetical protein BD770DRAFT_431196 [Pilaira anomala]|nr:hypothetical protein BD770DRAFT_431196 [Pilaira anomala]